jgi:hypothetical protein
LAAGLFLVFGKGYGEDGEIHSIAAGYEPFQIGKMQ